MSPAYSNITSIENLLEAWKEFLRGKKNRKDVQEFQFSLMDKIFSLHYDLRSHSYVHGPYHAFNISDPKPRNIHKATVRDRLLHHAIYRILYPYFDKKFISDSYSCRTNKGTHKALERFKYFSGKVSKNNTKQCFILKCDIKKFFASIDQKILLEILNKHIEDKEIVWLIERIVKSFYTKPGKGLPLGNLTSQLLVNVYMDEFDQFVKHKLKIKYYIRYADDFVFLSRSRKSLEDLIPQISHFLEANLGLSLHPDKLFIKSLSSGLDFLGWVNFPNHRVLRTVTKRRMTRNLTDNPSKESLSSYLGMLRWGNTHKLQKKIKDLNV